MVLVLFDSLECVAVLTVLFTTFLCYYFYVWVPYKRFPSHHLELKILYWIITRKPLNSILFQHLIKVLKHHENDGICTIWFLKPYIFVFGEETTKLLVNDPAAVDKPSIYKQFDFCLKDALFTCNGQKWRRMRMLISPAFQVSVIRDNIDVYNEYSAKLVQDLKTASPHEIIKCIKKCATHAFVETIYGLREENPENEFKINRMIEIIEKLGKFAIRRLVSPWLYFDFTLHIFPSGRKSLELYDEVHSRTKKILAEAKEDVMKGISEKSDIGYKAKSVAEVLLEQHIKNPAFSFEDVLYQIQSLTATNAEGVSVAIMWCLFLLGHHPDIQEKAYNEVVTETGETVDFNDLRKLVYLESTIKESFRLYPTIPLFARHLGKEVQYGQYRIPKNSTLIFVPYMLHRQPEIYPDPERFDPDRFMEPNSKINANNYTPFAEGARSCPGKNFAGMAMKVILCHVLRNFRVISLDRREDIVISWGIVLSSSQNLRMRFEPRTSENRVARNLSEFLFDKH